MRQNFLVPLLLAAGALAAPPQHVEVIPTTLSPTEAPTTVQPVAVISTTAVPAVPVITTTKPEVEAVEDIVTGFTEPPVEPLTTAAPVITTAAPSIITAAPIVAVPIAAVPTTTAAPPPPPPTKPPRLSGKEREALIAHLGQIDLRNTDKLVLTPRQRLAIALELEYQQLGLQPFQDPTPWQRLSREEQQIFNEKYLALPAAVQEFAKNQFSSLSDERMEHAFQMFLNLDVETLTNVIGRELEREREAQQAAEAERRRQQQERQRQEEARRQFELEQQRRRLQERPRSQQAGNRFNNIQQQQQFQQPQQPAPQFQARRPNNFDPRRRQPQPQQFQPQQQFQQSQQQFQQFQQQPQQQQFQQQPQQQFQQFQQQPQQQFQQFQQQPQQQQFQQRQPQQAQPTAAELRHLANAEAQIQEAVALQACLANPSGPGCSGK